MNGTKCLRNCAGKWKNRGTQHAREKLLIHVEQCGKMRKLEERGMKEKKCSENCAGR
jgi:hypothetical protein